jgi:hypothetical protein
MSLISSISVSHAPNFPYKKALLDELDLCESNQNRLNHVLSATAQWSMGCLFSFQFCLKPCVGGRV